MMIYDHRRKDYCLVSPKIRLRAVVLPMLSHLALGGCGVLDRDRPGRKGPLRPNDKIEDIQPDKAADSRCSILKVSALAAALSPPPAPGVSIVITISGDDSADIAPQIINCVAPS